MNLGVFMKRFGLATFMALLSLTHTVRADILVDLPDPGDIGGVNDILNPPSTTPEITPEEPQAPQAPVQTEYAGTIAINSMSRKSGGTLYKLDLQRPLLLNRVEIQVDANRLKVHQATITTESGRQIEVREFKDTRMVNTSEVLVSENLNLSENVASIEVTAESYGGAANIRFRAISTNDVPRLTLKPVEQPQAAEPSRPNNPPPPPPVRDTRPAALTKGVRVLYNQGHVGTVVQVLANGRVSVTLDGYSGTHEVEMRSLAAQTNCLDGLCSGYNVLYSDNHPGAIKTIFANRKAQIVMDGYSGLHIVDLNRLAKSVECLGDLCLNQSALYSGSTGANIKYLYTSGRARVTLEGYSGLHVVNVSSLSKSRNCYGNLCVGDSVMYNFTNKAKILNAYDSGRMRITINGYSGTHLVEASQLSRPTNCAQNVCVGDNVMYNFIYESKVLEIYANGQANVTIEGYSGTHNVPLNTLTKKINCQNGVCAGDKLMYNFTMEASVLKVFSNGTAQVTIQGYSGTHNVSQNTLTKKINCSKEICVGDSLIYRYTQQAKVLKVFANGSAMVTIEGFNGEHVVPLSTLSRIPPSKRLKEGDKIIYNYNTPGRITKIYDDGTADVSLSGYWGTERVFLHNVQKAD